nr:hypothetical protein [Tanacetum cinerariifolium]
MDDTMNEDTLVVVATAAPLTATTPVVDMTVETKKCNTVDDTTVEKENLSSLEDTIAMGSFPPLPTQVTTSAGNVPGKSSYANITDSILENGLRFIWNILLILKKWHPNENLLKEDVSTVLVWVKLHGVPVTAFSEDGLSAVATKLGTPLIVDSYTSDMCMQSWGRSSYARVMIELRADVELKDNIIVVMPKINREGHYTYNVRAEYEWKPPRCSSCKVFGHIHEECPKNTGAGEKKTVKKPSQTSRGISVGPRTGFKPQKVYRHVLKKSTASSSGNKKKGVEPTIEVSNSNQFDVLNLIDNDVEFGTNRGTTNLVDNGATSSGSPFMNADNSSSGTTPTIDKIDKFEDLLTSGQAILVDKAGNPLKNVELPGEYDSEDEVASVDNDMARSMASEMVGHDLSHNLQAICNNLDIRVRGRKKKQIYVSFV